MAVSGTVPARSRVGRDPARMAVRLRRFTMVVAVLSFTWFLLQFGTRWVPVGMDTVPGTPPGAWCIIDRWRVGMRVGSDVFIDTPDGELLSRVAALDAETVTVLHPNGASRWPDSKHFGSLPRSAVRGVVMVVFQPAGAETSRGR